MSDMVTASDAYADNEQYERLERALPQAFLAATADGAPLFTTDAADLFDVFLGALPEERRQHYSCHACRRFLNRFGGAVRIDNDGMKRSPLWEVEAPPFFAPAVASLARAVSRLERRGDVKVSTLRRVVEAIGGDLEISAIVGGERVRLNIG